MLPYSKYRPSEQMSPSALTTKYRPSEQMSPSAFTFK